MNSAVVNVDQCDVVKCSNCDRKLMLIVPGKQSDETLYKLQVECPFCGDHSYDYPVKGLMKYSFAEGVKFRHFQETDGAVKQVKFLTTK